MEHQTETDNGRELVLDMDNRKLILIFFGLLAICGCFFVAGYVIGKKADSQPANYADKGAAGNPKLNDNPGSEVYGRNDEPGKELVTLPSAVIEPPPVQPEKTVPAAAVSDNAVTDAERQKPLEATPAASADIPPAVSSSTALLPSGDKPESQPKATTGAKAAGSAAEKTASTAKPATAEKVNPPAKPAAAGTQASAKVVYSVQIAAFRARREVEIKARELEAKGYESRIEPPQTPGDYYRLKVGAFATRDEASEMANRLIKSGFETMITTIK